MSINITGPGATGSNIITGFASPIPGLTAAQIQSLTPVTLPMPGTIGSARISGLNIFMDQRKQKIGIIGLGFVGTAIDQVHSDITFVETVKIDPAKGHNNSYSDLKDADGVFVCVPSPSNLDGTADTSILENVLANLKDAGYKGVIISKVTAPPAVYKRLQAIHSNLVHCPEFLTAARANADYMKTEFLIIGGEVSAYRNEAERIIKKGLPSVSKTYHCSIEEASLAKYTINSFLATKVTFMNEIYRLAEKMSCDYNTVMNMVIADERIGSSHMRVPGPDGAFGFGGMCFPKDTQAMIKFAEEAGTDMMVLNAAVKKNTLLRLTEPK